MIAGEESARTVSVTAPGGRPAVPPCGGPQPMAARSLTTTATSGGQSDKPIATERVH